MSLTISELESELLRLDPVKRAQFAKMLLESLEELPDVEYDALWAVEAEARYADFKAGRTSAFDGDQVLAKARLRNAAAV